MADMILDASLVEDGELCFIIYVDRPKGAGHPLVADLSMNVVGPVSADKLRPRRLTGFELPAFEAVELAQRRAGEQGVGKILLIDPEGLFPLAKLAGYAVDAFR